MITRLLSAAILVCFLTAMPVIRAQQRKPGAQPPARSGEHQQNATSDGPAKTELESAIKAYTLAIGGKTKDHKFHVVLRPLTQRLIGRMGAPEQPMPGERLIPEEFRTATYTTMGSESEPSKDLSLDFIKLNVDDLRHLDTGAYVVCADMKGTDGKIYDIDFFMAGKTGQVNPIAVAVHKINGKPRYNWKEKGAVWKFSKL